MSPFQAVWRPDIGEGGAFIPSWRFHNRIAAEIGAGEVVTLERREARSSATHNHYFAAVNEAWANLREIDAQRFKSPEHLRKWALIRAGFHDERSIVCASKAEALRLAAFMSPLDEYAIVVPSEAVVTVYTAKSQSMRAMGKDAFQRSKEAVLSVLAALIEVEPEALSSAARETGARKSVGAAA